MPTFIVDIILVAFLLFLFIRGYIKGFLATVLRSLRPILAIIAAYFLGKPVAGFIDQKFIYGWTYNGVYAKINELYQNASESFNVDKIFSAFPKFMIPDSLREQLENSTETGEALVVSASESISAFVSHLFSLVIAYLLIFLIVWLLLLLLAKLLSSSIHDLPVIGKIDRILGALLGLLIGWVLLSLVATLCRFFMESSDYYAKTYVLKFFAENPITKYLSFLDFGALLSEIIPNK